MSAFTQNHAQQFSQALADVLSAWLLRGEKKRFEGTLPQRLLVAFSGGLDSTVLLHALKQLSLDAEIIALHVHHGLLSDADAWQSHCETFANALGVRWRTQNVLIDSGQASVERAAREARYQVFESVLDANSFLLTAHHADDQAETLWYRLMRGSGLLGLCGIPEYRSLGPSGLVRPLLGVERFALQVYAERHALSWIEDPSNQDVRFDRNFIRKKLLPVCRERWPKAIKKIGDTSQLLSEASRLLDEYAEEDLIRLGMRTERLGQSLDLRLFRSWDEARQRHVLRHCLRRSHYDLPSIAQMEQLSCFLEAGADAQPELSWGGCVLRRHADRLFMLPQLAHVQSDLCLHWNGQAALRLPDGSELSIAEQSFKNSLNQGESQAYTVRYRQGGERCQPRGRKHSQTLKKLLQAYGLEPWLRDRVPLVYKNDNLLAVGDLWLCESATTEAEAKFHWRYPTL